MSLIICIHLQPNYMYKFSLRGWIATSVAHEGSHFMTANILLSQAFGVPSLYHQPRAQAASFHRATHVHPPSRAMK